MGINLVWVCHDHKRYHYSMRGEEGVDFQALIRTPSEHAPECPAQCFRTGRMRVYLDSHFDYTQYEPWWSYEDRPAEVRKRGSS